MTNEAKHSDVIRRNPSKANGGVISSSTFVPPAVKGISHNNLFIFTILILLSSIITAQTFVETQVASSSYELAKDWRVLSIIFTMLTIIFVALAYMFGNGFNIPELKAWASTEMTQVVVNAIIIISLTAVISLLDQLVAQIVNGSELGFNCEGATLCAVTTAEKYLVGMIDISEDKIKELLDLHASASRTAAIRNGISFTELLPTLQGVLSMSPTAGWLMDAERALAVIEQLGNLAASMYAQIFFVKEISFKIAPIIMVMGIVARSFFVTRKLGGLLIAVGIGVMFVFPLMYVFDWLTLNVALHGASVITPAGGTCPLTCLLQPPKFYSGPNPIFTDSDLYEFLELSEDPNNDGNKRDSEITDAIVADVERLTRGEIASYTSPKNPAKTASSCEAAAHIGDGYCPLECRELPYSGSTTCNPLPVEEPDEGALDSGRPIAIDATDTTRPTCSAMPSVCKIIRYVNPIDPYFENAPVAGTEPLYADYELYDEDCPDYCRTVPALKNNCATGDSIHCPLEKDYCKYTWKDDLNARPNGCGVRLGPRTVVAKACEASPTATESCVFVLPDRDKLNAHLCDKCLFVEEPYTYDPPIYRDCASLCKGSPSGPPKVSPSEFAQRSAEGMIGKPEIKIASALMLPGYILPILNIAVTLMFIRSFSMILGGDIEIPGVSKIL